jgi:hypothetical protein
VEPVPRRQDGDLVVLGARESHRDGSV